MGLRNSGGYTAAMQPGDLTSIETGGLSIDPHSGWVHNLHGESIRLSPVNMKVLAVLLGRRGHVVSRSEIFDAVWGNQIIGDDALTRCISDIRAELRRLSTRSDLIETLPRRGYRWLEDVAESTAVAQPARKPDAPDTRAGTGRSRHDGHRRLRESIAKGIVYFALLAAMASALVWSIERLAAPRPPVVAVLPISAPASAQGLAARLEIELTDYVMALGKLSVLSRSAVDSRPANPFPYFYFEFGARWLIESELREVSGELSLVLTLVDARTGISLMRVSQRLDRNAADADPGVHSAFERLSGAIASELVH